MDARAAGSIGLAAAVAASSALAASLPQGWRTDPPPRLVSRGGTAMTLDAPLAALEHDPQTVTMRPPSMTVVARGATGVIPCAPRLDGRRVMAAADGVFRDRGLKPSFSAASERQVVMVSQPVLYGPAQARFYSYIAGVEGCAEVCRVRVSARRVQAPVEGTLIRVSQAAYSDDDVAFDLVESGRSAVTCEGAR